MPLVNVSEPVKERLEAIKARNGHKSFDSVIRYLLGEGVDAVIKRMRERAKLLRKIRNKREGSPNPNALAELEFWIAQLEKIGEWER